MSSHPSMAASRRASTRRISRRLTVCSSSFNKPFSRQLSPSVLSLALFCVRHRWCYYPYVLVILHFKIVVVRSLCCSLAGLYSVLKIGVRPFEIDRAVYRDFDDLDFLPPFWGFSLEASLEYLDVVFANGGTEQLAKIGECVMEV